MKSRYTALMFSSEQRNSPKIISVSELNKSSRIFLEKEFSTIWVKGEISKFLNHQNGHWYFTIKDERSSVDCVMFNSKNRYIKNLPDQGDEVLIQGKLSLYEAQGRFQLQADTLEFSGLGDLLKAYEQLKKDLIKEGIINELSKKIIPEFPYHIGIVTSQTGAVIKDIENILSRRSPLMKVTLSPSNVQGDGADKKIISAIDTLLDQHSKDKLDLILLARGGGSLEDLWCFNSESLARKIASVNIPIISAIGHETDFTISDLVADLRAPTPSAAAEIISEGHFNLPKTIQNFKLKIGESLINKIQIEKSELKNKYILIKRFDVGIEQKYQRIDDLYSRFNSLLKNLLHKGKLSISNSLYKLEEKNPKLKISNQEMMFKALKTRFIKSFESYSLRKKIPFKDLVSKLDSLSPLSVLARGYTITTSKNNQMLDNVKINIGDEIETRSHRNTISSKITKIKKN